MVHVHGPCLGAHVDRRMLMVPIGPEICTGMGHDQCWLALGGSEHQILRPWKLQYQYVSSQYQCQGALGVATNQRPCFHVTTDEWNTPIEWRINDML